MLSTLRRIKDQPAARHADKVLVQEFYDLARWIVRLDGAWEVAHAVHPLFEGYNFGVGHTERISQNGNHLTPRLPHGVLDMVDRIGRGVGDE